MWQLVLDMSTSSRCLPSHRRTCTLPTPIPYNYQPYLTLIHILIVCYRWTLLLWVTGSLPPAVALFSACGLAINTSVLQHILHTYIIHHTHIYIILLYYTLYRWYCCSYLLRLHHPLWVWLALLYRGPCFDQRHMGVHQPLLCAQHAEWTGVSDDIYMLIFVFFYILIHSLCVFLYILCLYTPYLLHSIEYT